MIKFYFYNGSKIKSFNDTDCPAFLGYDSLFEHYYTKGEKEFCENNKDVLKGIDREFKINILFVFEKNVRTLKFYKALSKWKIDKHNFIPLVTIGLNRLDKIETHLPLKFLDSSIWNYYIALKSKKISICEKSISEKIKAVFNIIFNNYKNRLYATDVAKEFIEFNYRLLATSKLYDGGNTGGHSKHMSPFVFHSEHGMKREARKVLNDINKIFNKRENTETPKIKWNLLLVDDFAKTRLNGGSKTKEEILKFILKTFFKTAGEKGDFNFSFQFSTETTSNIGVIKEAKEKLKKPNIQFDVILLDYLLGEKEEGSDKREYGDVFSKELDDEKGFNQGPLGKFWIFPISSFNSAMLSKLNEKGIEKHSDKWNILDGADMINTPNLFVYHFYSLLLLQLKQAIVTKNDILENLTQDNFKLEEGNAMNVRFVSRGKYGAFMQKFGVYEFLKLDKENNSAFATSVLKYIDTYRSDDIDFYENVRKLLYLVGYGSQGDKRRIINLLKKAEQQLPREYNIEEDNFKEPIDIVKNFENFQKSIKELKFDDDYLIMKIENLCNDVLKHLPNKYSLDSIKKLTIKDKYKLHHEILEFAEITNYSKANIDLLNSITGVILIEYKRKEDLLVFFRGIIDYTNEL